MAGENNRERKSAPPVGPRKGRGNLGHRPRAKDARGTLSRLLKYIGRQRGRLALVIVLVVAFSVLLSIAPALSATAIDTYIASGDLAGLARICFLMLGIYAVAAISRFIANYLMASVAQYTVRDMRKDLFAKMQTLSLRFFDQQGHGDIMSRVTNDVETVSNTLSQSLTQLIATAFTLVSVSFMMLRLNWILALVVFMMIPVMMLITRLVLKRTVPAYRAQQVGLGELDTIIEETVSGARVVKAYRQEQAVTDSFLASNEDLKAAAITAQTYSGFLGPISNALLSVFLALVAGLGGWLTLLGRATVGTIAAFVTYTRQFGRPINQMSQLVNTLQSAIAGAERVFEIMDQEPELVDAAQAPPLRDIQGRVVFDDVSFSYDKEVPVLKHVSFEAQPGQMIALVGPTGAGKTTIVNLVTRFYDIDDGAIVIDGKDIRDVQKDTLRQSLGIVLQDTYLFSMTVKENIRYGRLDATDEEIVDAARLANADAFIRRLPHGYDTMLSEDAGNLSQGQRQLLAIARAALADPAILILDEATSSVDTRTEVNIQEALLNLMEGRTSFVIAHRLSTIRNADLVLVVNDGQIIERGTHRELLAQRGFYYNLYMSQFKGNAHLMPDHLVDTAAEPSPETVRQGHPTGGPPPGARGMRRRPQKSGE